MRHSGWGVGKINVKLQNREKWLYSVRIVAKNDL